MQEVSKRVSNIERFNGPRLWYEDQETKASRDLETKVRTNTRDYNVFKDTLLHLECIWDIFMNILYMSQVAQKLKTLTAMQDTWVQSLGQEDLLEKGTATHSSILKFHGWRKILWMKEPGWLQSMGSQRVGHN